MPDLAETCKCGHQVLLCSLVARCEGCREACAMCDCPTPPDTPVPDSREPAGQRLCLIQQLQGERTEQGEGQRLDRRFPDNSPKRQKHSEPPRYSD
jgi:hypothetical protein